MYVPAEGGILYSVIGSAPNRQLIVSFYNVGSCCGSPGSDDSTYQAVFTEGSPEILVQYGEMSAIGVGGMNLGDGSTATSWTPAAETAYLVRP